MEHRGRYAAAATGAGLALGIGGWGASMSGYVSPALGMTLMFIGVFGFIAAITWGAWPKVQQRRWSRRKLRLEPKLESLSYGYPSDWRGAQMAAAFAKHSFAVIHVRNEWEQDLPKIVARCFLSPSNKELPCYWSKEAEGKFVPGGGRAADLPVWHQRSLVIAQVFGENKAWACLTADPEFLFHPASGSLLENGESYRTSMSGERLELGGKIELIVTFRAEKLRQTERLLCSFDANGPTFELLD